MQRTIDLPTEVCKTIGQALQRFVAEQPSVKVVARFHDHPMWFIRKESNSITRRVQVAPFETSEGTFLRMIPNAYWFMQDKLEMRTRQTIPSEDVESVPIGRIFSQAMSGDVDKVYKVLQEPLQSSWGRAEAIEESDLTKAYPVRASAVASEQYS